MLRKRGLAGRAPAGLTGLMLNTNRTKPWSAEKLPGPRPSLHQQKNLVLIKAIGEHLLTCKVTSMCLNPPSSLAVTLEAEPSCLGVRGAHTRLSTLFLALDGAPEDVGNSQVLGLAGSVAAGPASAHPLPRELG